MDFCLDINKAGLQVQFRDRRFRERDQARLDGMGMRLPVLVQVALGLEGEATRDTRVGPFTRMGPDVFLQYTGFGTRPAAVRANVLAGFFGFVLFLVSVFRLIETFLGVLAISGIQTRDFFSGIPTAVARDGKRK